MLLTSKSSLLGDKGQRIFFIKTLKALFLHSVFSQSLVNLLVTGHAVSNVWDGDRECSGMSKTDMKLMRAHTQAVQGLHNISKRNIVIAISTCTIYTSQRTAWTIIYIQRTNKGWYTDGTFCLAIYWQIRWSHTLPRAVTAWLRLVTNNFKVMPVSDHSKKSTGWMSIVISQSQHSILIAYCMFS